MIRCRDLRKWLVFGLFLQSSWSQAVLFDAGIAENQRASLEKDLERLRGQAIQPEGLSETARLLQVPSGLVDTAALEGWLFDRVRIIVPESWDHRKSVQLSAKPVSYPNRSEPLWDSPFQAEHEDRHRKLQQGGAMVVMANYGTAIYMLAKNIGASVEVMLGNGQREPIRSPRVGLIQIGLGLFHERLRINPESQDTAANSISRIATLFHEARHSDGLGKSLGFAHAVCPQGHDLAGYHACDRNRNGPYTIGAHLNRILLNHCDECSEKDREALRLQTLDSFSRILKSYVRPGSGIVSPTGELDPSPEFAE